MSSALGTARGTSASWVADSFGVRLDVTTRIEGPFAPEHAVELALRRNPRRAHLLVSRLLGKHIPVPVSDVLLAGRLLGAQVRTMCEGAEPIVVGFAETATALGHTVAAVSAADGRSAPYLRTTRHPAPTNARVVEFLEEHSHATNQTLAICDEGPLHTSAPLVLVDDEMTTGRTAVNAIRALHAIWPRPHYILASLLDARSPQQSAEVQREIGELGATVHTLALLAGRVTLPDDLLSRTQDLCATLPMPPSPRGSVVDVAAYELLLPPGVPMDAAQWWTPANEVGILSAIAPAVKALPVQPDSRTLLLGDEEFMYLPQLMAAALGPGVLTSTTTRSPAVVLDVAGYPLRTALSFPATHDASRPSFAYNVAASRGRRPSNAPGFDDVVLVTDAPSSAHLSAGLLAQLSRSARRGVHVVHVRAAPPEPSDPC